MKKEEKKEEIRNIINHTVFRFTPSYFCVTSLFMMRNKGKKLLRNLRKECNSDTKLFVCPYPGTGDVYLALALAGERFEKENDYRVIVIGKSNKKIVNLFGVDRVVDIKEKEMNSLVRYIGLTGDKNNNVFLMHPSPPQFGWGINDMFRNICGINFLDMYRYGVFSGKTNNDLAKPIFDETSRLTTDLFEQGKLKKENTVLLAPHSNTLNGLPDWVWVKMADRLIAKGYQVYTNCASKEENPIKHTEGLFIPYKELKCFLEMAGNFIGVRSGFCEVISTINCKKVVLYNPNIFWGEGTCTDYFSLKAMNLCEDSYELEYEGIEFEKLIDDVLALF